MSAPDPLQSFRLDGEVAAVTGGGNGIGRAVALAYARVGAVVAVLDRDEAAARRVAETIEGEGGRAAAIAVDVADEAQVERAVAEIEARFGRLDVLFNNAGTAIRKPTLELPLADWQ
jgi:3-hydroxybutyrate dehydrogenase